MDNDKDTEKRPGPDDRTETATPEPGGQMPPDQPPVQPPPEQAGWGAPPPPPEQRSRWSLRRTLVAVAIAVGIAAAGGAAIYAASGSVGEGGGRGGGPGVIVHGPMTELAHGEFQNGEVTAISDTSVTAESEDGYERTYTIDEDTRLSDGIETGDEVMIMATVDGDTATAVTVVEQGTMPRRGDDDGPPRMRGDGN